MSRAVFPALVLIVLGAGLYLIFWTASHGKLIHSAALAIFLGCVFLSQTKRYAQTQIRVYGKVTPSDDEGPEL